MSPAGYAFLAYGVGLGLMVGYGVRLWILARALGRGRGGEAGDRQRR